MQNNQLKTGTILLKALLAENILQFQVFAPEIARHAQPGQFVILRLNDRGERIPLTLVDTDAREGTICLIVQIVGKSTGLLAQLKTGETIPDLLGPLGKPSHIRYFGQVLVIGGGVGTAVAYSVAKALKYAHNQVTTIIGARSKEWVILEQEMRVVSDDLHIATDDGSLGFHGFVTELLQILIDSGKHFDRIIAVGPLSMMKVVSDLTRPLNIDTTVSLNTIMVDGTGMCGGCRVMVGNEVKFTCIDGPEFDGHLVDFETLSERNRSYDHLDSHPLEEPTSRLEKQPEEKVAHTSQKFRQPMPEFPLAERVHSFDEVALGYTHDQAIFEARRCLNCRNPECVQGCPVSVRIPEFIQLILQEKTAEAGRLILQDNALPRICGRVCPQSEQCEGACILSKKGRPIAIGALERYASDQLSGMSLRVEHVQLAFNAPHVALIGSGPACLSCASDLVKGGVNVTVFEAFHAFGGVLRYGIPEFRLPKQIVTDEISALSDKGVTFVPNCLIGSTITLAELLEGKGFQAAFIGIGAGLPYFLNIPGESLVGVYSANEFLIRVNLMKAYQYPETDTPVLNFRGKRVAIIGGGNTALDSARVSLRLGAAEVSLIYRRTEAEMPGRVEEIHHAKAEGVNFSYLRNPVEFIGNEKGWLQALKLIKMQLGELDSSQRRRPIPIPNSDYTFPVDIAIVAVGNGSNPNLQRNTPGLEFDHQGHLMVNPDTLETSLPGVFAGGDIVTGGATVIQAMGAGRRAAKSILAYLQKYHR